MKIPTDHHLERHAGTIRRIDVGGLTKKELIEELRRNAVLMNGYAEQLFACDHFTTSQKRYTVDTVDVTLRDLGFDGGARISKILAEAEGRGLNLCPLELGPHLRLQYLDQAEGDREEFSRRGAAPSGSLTVASPCLTANAHCPQGFYLRRINDELWLRGYCASQDYEWDPDDHFVFLLSGHSGSERPNQAR